MNKLIAFTTFLLMLAGSVSGTAVAQSYPFKSAGTLDQIDYQAKVVVIDDTVFPLGSSLIVYDHNNRLTSAGALKVGGKVGINLAGSGPAGGKPVVYEIWVLPDSFDISRMSGPMGVPTP